MKLRTLAAALCAAIAFTSGCRQEAGTPAPPRPAGPLPAPARAEPGVVGIARCAECHPAEVELYRRSDHARAMEVAEGALVLGDFSGTTFTQAGEATTFLQRDGGFFVRAAGPDGAMGEYPVAYTCGADPLQQYLLRLPGGRLQALGVAWDTRPRAAGGQRWFHLSPAAPPPAGDPFHWTGRQQTWNHQCAECHVTDLRKRYDPVTDSYDSQWAELTVSCEACHGPGAAHVAWAAGRRVGEVYARPGETALSVHLEKAWGVWDVLDLPRGIATWVGAPRTNTVVDACARCHARRQPIVEPYPYGVPFLDTHRPSLLEEGVYEVDGQILDEAYEYGSFLQSRMHAAGVTCSDCHEPHALGLRGEGNAVCATCHLSTKFDDPSHHHHKAGSDAARCVSCHMTSRTYMGVDRRRDHSFRVPRPDLTAALGTRDACSSCHAKEGAAWSARKVAAWFGPDRKPHYGTALAAGRSGDMTAESALAALSVDGREPGIARATALELLGSYLSAASLPALAVALNDADPMVRAAALGALDALPPEERPGLARTALSDPIRTVRIAVARALAAVPRSALDADDAAALDGAIAEAEAAERVSGDRSEPHLGLGSLYLDLERTGDAEREMLEALRLDPGSVAARVNLADLRRAQGRDDEGERLLAEALSSEPENAEALHALGLLRVRQKRTTEAERLLRRAAAARPESSRYAYVHAVCLGSLGDGEGAIRVLEEAHACRPADRDVLAALVGYAQERRDHRRALLYAQRLAALSPDDAALRQLVDDARAANGSTDAPRRSW